jgi:cytochrome c5
MKKSTSLLTLAVVFLLTGLTISACSGNSGDGTSAQKEPQSLEEPTQPIPEANPSVEPTPASTAAPEPRPTYEPTVEVPPTDEEQDSSDTTLDGKTLLDTRCTTCHDLSRVTSKSKTLEEWRVTVERMVDKGADLNTDEQETLIQYLAENYP